MNDEQRQEIIRLLQQAEELSPEWARILFPPEKREYELVYHGKEREEDILADTLALPLQKVRTFGSNGDGWHNHLIFGDNLQVMKSLLERKKAGQLRNADGTDGVRLVYIDPPFATKREFSSGSDQKAYSDKLSGTMFIEWMRKRILLCRELLSPDASIVIHMDDRKAHEIKVITDELLGTGNFRNAIIWRRSSSHNKLNKQFGPIHDTLLFYGCGNFVFTPGKRPFMRGYIEERFTNKDARGIFQTNYLTGPGVRAGDSGKPWRGFDPTNNGRHWAIPKQIRELCTQNLAGLTTQDQLDVLAAEGLLHIPKKVGGQPMYKQYLTAGVPFQDLWAYQSNSHGTLYGTEECIDEDVKYLEDDPESVGYPTQKPEGLIARIIQSLSRPGDIVLDAFAGSGTTCVVAEKLRRRWIGIDCGKLAIYTIQKRLLNLRKEIGNKGATLTAKPFTLYNAGLYDFSQLKELSWDAWRFFALQLFQCRDESHSIGGIHFDGWLKGASVLVFNHQKQPGVRISEESIVEMHEALGSRVGRKVFIIAPALVFDFQQDYVDIGDVRYYALRIPYSIIHELHQREFMALQQPADELAVNDTVEAVGFDFIRRPELEYETGIKAKSLSEAFIRVTTFKSEAQVREPLRKKANLETLSMVMLDYDFDSENDLFELNAVFYADAIEKADWEIRFPRKSVGRQVMAVFVDIYGNEARELIPGDRFMAKKGTSKIATSKTKLAKKGRN